jgi:hypothetical protein
MTKSAQLRWIGNVVRIGDERYPEIAWKARKNGKETQRNTPTAL